MRLKSRWFQLSSTSTKWFSLWGNYNELCEVIELAKQAKISHSIQEFPLTEINKVADMLRNGEIKGRAVIVPK
jgi:D-arabinose 1-dehydrogenase-like Zn-dependent alcohol dehydrogenase